MNSNATLKIRKGPEEGKRKFRGRRGRDATDPKTVKEKEASSRGCSSIGSSKAQDEQDRKSTRLNSSHIATSRMPSSA